MLAGNANECTDLINTSLRLQIVRASRGGYFVARLRVGDLKKIDCR
jgi:hypothetical protein